MLRVLLYGSVLRIQQTKRFSFIKANIDSTKLNTFDFYYSICFCMKHFPSIYVFNFMVLSIVYDFIKRNIFCKGKLISRFQ